MKRKLHITILSLLAALVLAWAAQPATGESLTVYKDEDLNVSYDLSTATRVDLGQQQGTYTISQGGAYVLTGSMTGQLVIQAPEADTVWLVMDNASISNPDGVAIYGLEADKIILTLAEGTSSLVSDGAGYAPDEEGADAAIYTKTDLTINGSGSLTVNGQTAHGILSKDDLVIAGGTLTITSVKDGLRGKDSVAVREGSISVTAGSDGIVATGTETGTGYVQIDGGTFTIKAQRDGIQAETDMIIRDGAFDITTGTGTQAAASAEAVQSITVADATTSATRQQNGGLQRQNPQQDGGWQEPVTSNSTAETMKALKAGVSLTIKGGRFNLNAQDDAVHSNGDVTIENGIFTITTGDDGVHADNSVLIKGGDLTISGCYEGLEGKTVTIDGGSILINASDDGINAAGGAAASGGREAAQAGVQVIINGGTVKVTAGFDGIDSNGTLAINGGVVDLTSQRSGGGGTYAIDTNGGYTYTAGQVTTNDGSEKGTTQAGGFQGRPGGQAGFPPTDQQGSPADRPRRR
ncbi:MAG: carbohydrate-binding domain-containing protein [Christensenellales bacterium]